MATVEQCEAALRDVIARLHDVDLDTRRRHAFDRTIACRVPDLGVEFSGRLEDGSLRDLRREPARDAQIRLQVASDDLVALTTGSLGLAAAWASGRLQINASLLDLLRLKAML